MNRVLVTGATGFIGSAIVKRLQTDRIHDCIAALRNVDLAATQLAPDTEIVKADFRTSDLDYSVMMDGVEVLIHTAALTKFETRDQNQALADLERVNVEATLQLARQAISSGVRRFIFLSTVGVYGSKSGSGPFRESDEVDPGTPYADSKYRAELGLQNLLSETSVEWVLIRAPMVYGAGATGKFSRLVRLISSGVPLPFGKIDNRRSFIALPNLVDFVVACIDHPAAANQIFLVSDGEDLSTPELVERLARAIGKPLRLFSISPALVGMTLSLLGQNELRESLLGSYQLDISQARRLLGWKPPVTVDQALREAVSNQAL